MAACLLRQHYTLLHRQQQLYAWTQQLGDAQQQRLRARVVAECLALRWPTGAGPAVRALMVLLYDTTV